MALCAKHSEEWQRWLDYRPPPPAPDPLNPPGPARHRVSRGQRAIKTIRAQHEQIERSCADGADCSDDRGEAFT